jgi:hypothetical protein
LCVLIVVVLAAAGNKVQASAWDMVTGMRQQAMSE